MIKAVPTAKRINPARDPSATDDFPPALDFSRRIPTLHCQVTEDGKQVRFRCGYCNRYHSHGNVPKDSPNKGHRAAHCHAEPNPYPNGYYLRTDLDWVYCQQYPNFAVINSTEKAFNAHVEKCKRMELPTVSVRCERNFAMVDIDFVTTNHKMSGTLGVVISTVGKDYRRLHHHRVKGKKRQLGCYQVDPREGREIAMFWIFINDAYPLADVLMPLVNHRAYWQRVGQRRLDDDF